jgi:hypothetical protein
MASEVDRQELLTMLTTEHFTLQGARGSTIAESSARSALYLGSLSASLVSLAFVAQISTTGDAFRVFALVVLPTVFVLGLFTFVRQVETMAEDLLYGRAINRIRSYYIERAGPEARYFMFSAHDDAIGVLRNMGITPTKRQLYLTAASAISVVNSVVGGAALGIAVWVAFDAGLAVSSVVGATFALASVILHHRWLRRPRGHGLYDEVLSPSPRDS